MMLHFMIRSLHFPHSLQLIIPQTATESFYLFITMEGGKEFLNLIEQLRLYSFALSSSDQDVKRPIFFLIIMYHFNYILVYNIWVYLNM